MLSLRSSHSVWLFFQYLCSWSISIFASNLSSLRLSHVGSFFTNEEQSKAGLWRNTHRCHTCHTCSWRHMRRTQGTKWQSSYGRAFSASERRFFNKLDHKSIINYCCEVRLTDWLLSFRLVRQMKLIKLATLISSCPADEAVCNRTRCSREIAARSQTCKGKRSRKNS